MRRKESDHEVGFGKPPVEHQFKKGQSGNPAGRPKKSKAKPVELSDMPVHVSLLNEIQRTFNIVEAGVTKEVTMIEALQKKRLQMALGGNRLVAERLMDELKALESKAMDRRIDEFHRLENLKRAGERQLEAARASGAPAPFLMPHPDDIEIDEARITARITGPSNDAEQKLVDYWLQMRELLTLLGVRYRRFSEAARDAEPNLSDPGVWAHIVERWLPKRLRRTECEWISAVMRLRTFNNREIRGRISATAQNLLTLHPALPPLSSAEQEAFDKFSRRLEAFRRGRPSMQKVRSVQS